MSNQDESIENIRIEEIEDKDDKSALPYLILYIIFIGLIAAFVLATIFPLAKIDMGLMINYIKINGKYFLRFAVSGNLIESGKLTPDDGYYLSIFPMLLIGIIGTTLTFGVITPLDVISKKPRYIKILYKINCVILFISSISGFIGIMMLLNYVQNIGASLIDDDTSLTILGNVILVIFALNSIFSFFTLYESLSIDTSIQFTGVKRSIVLNIVRFEFKRVIFNVKFFVALSLVLLPAIIFLNSIARDYEALLLDFGKESFQSFSAAGFVIIAQFLLQMVAIMLTLDSFGKTANDSMKRYFALPILRIEIYIAHMLNIIIGIAITSVLAIAIFDMILWIWTSISISFILLLKSLFLVLIGSILVVAITTFFIIVAQMFNLSSSIAIIPTLFLFYIIPFLVNFVSQFVYGLPEAYRWTFMYQLTIATDFMIQPRNGLHEIVEPIVKRNAWLAIGLVTAGTEIVSGILFTQSEN